MSPQKAFDGSSAEPRAQSLIGSANDRNSSRAINRLLKSDHVGYITVRTQ